MNSITVTVAGPAGSGKSAIARLVEMALCARGLRVERIDDNGYGLQDEREGVIESSLDVRVAAVCERSAVMVTTKMSTETCPRAL